MIYQATKDIEAAIKSQEWNCGIDERENSSAVITGFNLKVGISMQIIFISAADNDAAIRVFQFLQTPESKRAEVLKVCNSINRQFRFTKFVLQDDGYVGIEMDVAVETKNIGEVCLELLMRLLNIAEEAYPIFMSAIGGPVSSGNASPNSERY